MDRYRRKRSARHVAAQATEGNCSRGLVRSTKPFNAKQRERRGNKSLRAAAQERKAAKEEDAEASGRRDARRTREKSRGKLG